MLVAGHQRSVVSERVVIQEESTGDVEGDEHVDGVVLVSGQQEEDGEQVRYPGERVQLDHAPRGVYRGHGITFYILY